jgi:hypothetical protein
MDIVRGRIEIFMLNLCILTVMEERLHNDEFAMLVIRLKARIMKLGFKVLGIVSAIKV